MILTLRSASNCATPVTVEREGITGSERTKVGLVGTGVWVVLALSPLPFPPLSKWCFSSTVSPSPGLPSKHIQSFHHRNVKVVLLADLLF